MNRDEITVFITAPQEEEAVRIAKSLVERKFAACVNIVRDVRSIYRWEGKVEDEAEVLMVVKTRAGLFQSLAEEVTKLHSYSVPEILALPILTGSAEYMKWIRESTNPE